MNKFNIELIYQKLNLDIIPWLSVVYQSFSIKTSVIKISYQFFEKLFLINNKTFNNTKTNTYH